MNEKLISDIENIRNQTNIRTVEFLRLLTELNPKQSKRLLNEIQLLDSKVIELSELLHMSTKRTKLEILNEIEQIHIDDPNPCV